MSQKKDLSWRLRITEVLAYYLSVLANEDKKGNLIVFYGIIKWASDKIDQLFVDYQNRSTIC